MHQVTIERMTYGIDSLGHVDGKVVFVPYGAPEDELEIEIKEEKTDYSRGEIIRILKQSPQRQEPPCKHFPECGGCHWLHLQPEVQRQEKDDYLKFILKKLNPKVIYPIEPLPFEGYRNKMDLKPAITDDGRLLLGNYRFRSYDVVDIPNCVVQCKPNREMYNLVRNFLEKQLTKEQIQAIKQISFRSLGLQRDLVVMMNIAPDEPILDKWREFFNQNEVLSRLEVFSNDEKQYLTLMREKPPFSFMNRSWFVSPRSFFQNNLEGAEAIYYTLMSIYESVQHKGKFLDLYCGVGIQTMLLESLFDEVYGVEANEVSFRDALKNQKGKRPNQIRFIQRKAELVFNTPITKGVIAALHMNPPRTGLSVRVMRGLMGIKPKLITYLSCNPMTFRRDAQAIIQMGYVLERVHPFDLFPGTFHFEILGVFTR